MPPVLISPPDRLTLNGQTYRCVLGWGGVIAEADKREGDGCTPLGTYPIREIWYRADRVALPPLALPVRAITPDDGWCDDPAHPQYNQHVRLPFAPSHEALWRDDSRYDIVIVLGHNDNPVVPGLGSCIFWHIATADYQPTAGCVAISMNDMMAILPHLAAGQKVAIGA